MFNPGGILEVYSEHKFRIREVLLDLAHMEDERSISLGKQRLEELKKSVAYECRSEMYRKMRCELLVPVMMEGVQAGTNFIAKHNKERYSPLSDKELAQKIKDAHDKYDARMAREAEEKAAREAEKKLAEIDDKDSYSYRAGLEALYESGELRLPSDGLDQELLSAISDKISDVLVKI